MRLCFARRLHRTTRTRSGPLSDNEISTDPLPREGLDRLHDQLASEVAAGHVPGLVSLVARGDDVHVGAIGTPSLTDDTPLARDAIFRIASLTKPIVAAAALALVEEGVLGWHEPIDELVPELASRRVLRSLDAELDDTVPARRSIVLEDLLSYRLGFGSVMMPPGTYPIQRAEAELGTAEHRRSPLAPRGARCRRMDRRPGHTAPHVPAGRAVAVQHLGSGARDPGGTGEWCSLSSRSCGRAFSTRSG